MYTTPTSSNSVLYSDSWLQESTARAQRELVSAQLQEAQKVEPFYQFNLLWEALMRYAPSLQDNGRLLDVGCGVGHYGVLLKRLAPRVRYTGTDLSPSMIEARIDPEANLHVAEFMENDFHAYDVVLLSQAMEMTPDPRAALRHVLATLLAGGWLMLHRLRHDHLEERVVHEPTYGGLPAHNYFWNLDSLQSELREWGQVMEVHSWANRSIASLLFHKNV